MWIDERGGGVSLSEFGFLRTGQSATPLVVSIAFDDGGLAITDRHGKVDWLAYSALIVRDTPGDRIILGQRFRPRFRLDLAGSAAREFRARTPPLESRWSRLRRWAIRSPKLAALAILVPAYLLEHLPGQWLAPITPPFLAARLDAGVAKDVANAQCRSKDGQRVLDALVRRLTPAGVALPATFAINDHTSFVSARLSGQLVVSRPALVEIEAPVLAALIAHELAHIHHGDLIWAAGRGEGTSYIGHMIQGSWAERQAAFEFSEDEEARADRVAIDLLAKHRIALGPAAAFFARDEKARREGSYWAQSYTNAHPGLPNRGAAWAIAARRQRATVPLLDEKDADDLYNLCWQRREGIPLKWAP